MMNENNTMLLFHGGNRKIYEKDKFPLPTPFRPYCVMDNIADAANYGVNVMIFTADKSKMKIFDPFTKGRSTLTNAFGNLYSQNAISEMDNVLNDEFNNYCGSWMDLSEGIVFNLIIISKFVELYRDYVKDKKDQCEATYEFLCNHGESLINRAFIKQNTDNTFDDDFLSSVSNACKLSRHLTAELFVNFLQKYENGKTLYDTILNGQLEKTTARVNGQYILQRRIIKGIFFSQLMKKGYNVILERDTAYLNAEFRTNTKDFREYLMLDIEPLNMAFSTSITYNDFLEYSKEFRKLTGYDVTNYKKISFKQIEDFHDYVMSVI